MMSSAGETQSQADLQARFAAAAALAQQGDMQGADRAFASIAGDHPTCHEAHYMRGRICMALGQGHAAMAHLQRAEALDTGNPEYLLRLGQLALGAGDSGRAVAWLEQARGEVEEDSPDLAIAYARALAMDRRFEEASLAFARACELAPDDAALWGARAPVQQRLGDLDGAEASLRRAIELAPDDAAPGADLAVMFERSNKLEKAREAVEAALRIDPSHPAALLARARLTRRAGDWASARTDLEQALERSSNGDAQREICLTLAQVLDELGAYDDAYRRMLESKRPIEEVPAAMRAQGEEFIAYVRANRGAITEYLVRSWPVAPPAIRESPVFFVGFPRSGTTLLEQMLASHPRFVTTDERGSLPRVREHIRQAAGSTEAVPTALGRLTGEQVEQLRDVYWQDIDELFGDTHDGRRVVDKHPLNTANLAIVRRLFPDAPVIMSLRDPRDVCVSCMMNITRTPMAATLFQTFETTAEFYGQVMDLWLHFRDVLGLRHIETKYEDVIEDAPNEARRVIEFLGEPWSDEVLAYRERAQQRAIRSPSYEQVTRTLHRGAIGRWRNYAQQMGSVLDTLAPFVRRLGYESA